jgi:short-subunit dehydrogenase
MMAFNLKGAVVLLTGAASGMGAELAVQLARKGAHLALVDRNETGLEATAARARIMGVTVSTHVLDIGDEAALAALPETVVATHGQISVLINNAGVALVGTFEQASLADFEWLMNINFWGAVRLTHLCLPLLRRQPSGHIVFVSSVFGLVGPPGQTAYAAAKFALRGFGEALRHELEGSPIRVTVVHPGGIDTNIARSARVGEHMDAAAAQAGVAMFQKLLKTGVDVAAARIVQGIIHCKPRVLIGRDAWQIDWIQRLLPATYWRILGRRTAKLNALIKPKA